MNSEIKFKTLTDLYNRIYPALKSKTKELHKKEYHYIHEEDIWNYLKSYKWTSSRDLDLASMVNDIFNIEEKELSDYVLEKVKKYHREINKEEI